MLLNRCLHHTSLGIILVVNEYGKLEPVMKGLYKLVHLRTEVKDLSITEEIRSHKCTHDTIKLNDEQRQILPLLLPIKQHPL